MSIRTQSSTTDIASTSTEIFLNKSMGICSSCEATSVATAKLIMEDGRLQEYPYPVTVSHVLHKNPSCFVCNSDDMRYDDVASAVAGDEELQLGQLYFALPLSLRNRRLRAEDMAALAVKASSALGGSVVVFSGKNGVGRPLVDVGESGSLRRMRSGGAGRRGRIPAMMSAIPE